MMDKGRCVRVVSAWLVGLSVVSSSALSAPPREAVEARAYLARVTAARAAAREANPTAGVAAGFASLNVNLLAQVPVGEMSSVSTGANDIWGYVSPAGREYAIVGLTSSTAFVDVTDPTAPLPIADIPDAPSTWSDMRTFGEFAYNVNESGGGMQILDLRNIDSGIVTNIGSAVGGLTTSHNISVNEQSGFLYACSSNLSFGLVAFELSDPSNPTPVGSWFGGACHDVYATNYANCPYAGRTGACEIAFVFAGSGGLKIVDVTDKANMTTISTYTYTNLAFCHQGWLTPDKKHVIFGDELDEQRFGLPTTTYIANVEDLAAPFRVNEFFTGLPSIDHNLIIRGNFAFEADYTTGLQVFDVSDVNNVVKVGFFDTFPSSDGPNFGGAWGVYPLLPSGIVLISDEQSGLFVLDASPAVGCQQDSHCNDRNGCTTDSCNATGQCAHTLVGAGTLCDDSDPCTIAGVCNAVGVCGVTDVTTIPCIDATPCAGGTCGITGFCECAVCTPLDRPSAEQTVIPKERYITVVPGNPGVQTALRVTFASMPAPFNVLNGTQMWVGAPFSVTELPGSDASTPADFLAARLTCNPVFLDWGAVGPVNVFGERVVPGGTFSIQAVSSPCLSASPPRFSTALQAKTSRWGDLVRDCTVQPCKPPDGEVTITDLVGILDKFASKLSAPSKVRADTSPGLPDFIIDISDITRQLSAFSGDPYPFPVPTPCP